MKTWIIAITISILFLSLVTALNAESQDMNRQQRENIKQYEIELAKNNSVGNASQIIEMFRERRQAIKDDLKELRETRKELKGDIKAYLKERKEILTEIKGNNLTIQGSGEEIRLKVKNFTARTTMNITQELDSDNNTILVIQKGNTTHEIKIMPDTASERALERLKMKVCNETNNCMIELKDFPAGKVKKIAYEIQIQRHYKLLGLFKLKAINKAEVNAETGETTVKKPWWSFLASQQDN
jgi:hypothetical protein